MGNNISQKAKDRIFLCKENGGTDLNLSQCNSKRIPKRILRFKKTLKKLNVGKNTIQEFYGQIEKFLYLETLIAESNELKETCPQLSKLEYLTYLDVSNNILSIVPNNLKALITLNISYNSIQSFGNATILLPALQELIYTHNKVSIFPTEILELRTLRILNLAGNRLNYLPDEISHLAGTLVELNISDNVFTSFPTPIATLINLETLSLSGNNLGTLSNNFTTLSPDIGEGYKSGSVFILKIVTLVMVAGCVAVFITALKGNSSTTSGINNLSDTIFNKTSYILDELVGISIELNQTKYEQFGERVEIQNQLNQIIDYGNDIESKGETVSDNAKDVNTIRNKIIVIGLVFCVINAGTIGVAALFGLPAMARSAAMSLVFLIPFMWIVFSVHYPINSVVADICMSYNNNTGSIEQQLANYTNPIVSEIFGTCQDSNNFNSSALKNLDTTVVNLIQNATSSTCDKINDACQVTFPRYPNDDPAAIPYNQNVLDCPPSVTCGNSTIGIYIYNSTVHNFQYKCKNSANCGDTSTCDTSNPLNLMTCGWVNVTSVNECSQGNCIYNSNTQVTDAAKDIVNFYDILTSLINIWTQQFSPLFKCSSILSFIDDVQNIVCVDEVNALDLIVAPTAVFAILLTGLGITGVLGSKRFDSKMRAKK